MRRALITGGAGFIGSNLVRKLIHAGYEVLNVDALTYAGNLRSLDDIANCSNYRFARVDITNLEALRSTVSKFAPTSIIHLAAESHVDRSIDGPGQFIQTNVVGTYNVLQAACELANSANSPRDFRFLHVSTDEVFGSLGAEGFFTESTPYDPHSPYSASKAASDHLARAWHDTYRLPVIVTNCSNNYGPFQFPEKLIPVVILKCLRGEPIPVYGKGENIRDWLFVEDHCDALTMVLENGRIGETYNIGGNNELRNIDLVCILCDLMDESLAEEGVHRVLPCSSLITFVPDRPGHDLRYAIDASKIRRELGWSPKQDRLSGLRKTVRWYLEHREWWEEILNGEHRLERFGLHATT